MNSKKLWQKMGSKNKQINCNKMYCNQQKLVGCGMGVGVNGHFMLPRVTNYRITFLSESPGGTGDEVGEGDCIFLLPFGITGAGGGLTAAGGILGAWCCCKCWCGGGGGARFDSINIFTLVDFSGFKK